MIENHENTTVSAAVFRPAVNISDVIIKAGKCGKNISNITNQLLKDKCPPSHFSPFLLLFMCLEKGAYPENCMLCFVLINGVRLNQLFKELSLIQTYN